MHACIAWVSRAGAEVLGCRVLPAVSRWAQHSSALSLLDCLYCVTSFWMFASTSWLSMKSRLMTCRKWSAAGAGAQAGGGQAGQQRGECGMFKHVHAGRCCMLFLPSCPRSSIAGRSSLFRPQCTTPCHSAAQRTWVAVGGHPQACLREEVCGAAGGSKVDDVAV